MGRKAIHHVHEPASAHQFPLPPAAPLRFTLFALCAVLATLAAVATPRPTLAAVDSGYTTMGRLSTSFDSTSADSPTSGGSMTANDMAIPPQFMWNGCWLVLVTPAGWSVDNSDGGVLRFTALDGSTLTIGVTGSIHFTGSVNPDMAISLAADVQACTMSGPPPVLELGPKPDTDPAPAHWADRYRAL